MGLIIGSQQSQRPSSEGAVRYDRPQSLTATQKETAQMNIGVQKIAELIINDLVSGGTDKVLSAEMGKTLKQLIDSLSLGKFYGIFASVDDLPTGSDAGYAYVGTSNPFAIYNFNGAWADSGTTIDNATEVVNNLTTDDATKALSAAMGVALSKGYQFMGVATPETNPGNPDQKVFYVANGVGIYAEFGGITVVAGKLTILKWDSSWSKEEIDTGIHIIDNTLYI